MIRKARLAVFAVSLAAAALSCFCGKDKEPIYLLYYDIIGNAEYEADGVYPPPDNLDNSKDFNITVTLYFGEPLSVFEKDDVYGYYITVDENPYNFAFKFVPEGTYYLVAELVVADSCFYVKTNNFDHLPDVHTDVGQIHPTFLGVNQGCFDVILTGETADNRCVQVSDRMWVTQKVYEQFYKDKGLILEP